MRFWWRHELLLVRSKNPGDQLTLIRFARDNGFFGQGLFPDIQTELGLSFVLIRPMTRKAIVREEWTNVAVVSHGRWRSAAAEGQCHGEQQSGGEAGASARA